MSQSRSLYLYNLSHITSPPLNQYINNKFVQFNRLKLINYLESAIQICNHCGISLIPGLSLHVKLSKRLQYKCLGCHKTKYYTIKKESKNTGHTEVKSKAKQRKKIRNQTLTKMLTQQKKSKELDLDLMEFLS